MGNGEQTVSVKTGKKTIWIYQKQQRENCERVGLVLEPLPSLDSATNRQNQQRTRQREILMGWKQQASNLLYKDKASDSAKKQRNFLGCLILLLVVFKIAIQFLNLNEGSKQDV